MSAFKTINSKKLFQETFKTMKVLFGEQSHIPMDTLIQLAIIHPDLFLNVTDKNGKNLGHLVILPFNQSGVAKITDDKSYEEDLSLLDFEVSESTSSPIYLFVYSIFGRNKITSAKLVLKTYEAVSRLSRVYDQANSYIFAEVVSPTGKRISEKMNMSHYHTYEFDGEELELYKASFSDFLDAKKAKSLSSQHK